MLARTLSLAISLLLPMQLYPGPSAAGGAASLAPKCTQAAAETMVGQLIQALLDTSTAGSAAVDARLALQAGPSVRAFYGTAPAPAWTPASDSITPAAAAVLALLADAPAYGLHPADYGWPRLQALRDSLARYPAAEGRPARQSRFEVYLSDAVLRLALDLHHGRLQPGPQAPPTKHRRAVFRPAEVLRAGLASGHIRAAVLAGQPINREYRTLQAALGQRLNSPRSADSTRRWHAENEQIALNLERWRGAPIPDSEYVLINLPAYVLQVVRHDSVVQLHRVIVGQPTTPTPTLSSAITYFTTAPDWHVPQSIAIAEMLPRLRKNPGYLYRYGLALYDRQGRRRNPYHIRWQLVTPETFTYTISQAAGGDNALGNIVFRFSNPYAVYLHDTPLRQFFKQPNRAFSHGCIRVAEPARLAAYLLRHDGKGVRPPSEKECANEARNFQLHHALPIHVRYATCAVTAAGQLRFYADVYGLDEALRQALLPTWAASLNLRNEE